VGLQSVKVSAILLLNLQYYSNLIAVKASLQKQFHEVISKSILNENPSMVF